MAQCAIAHWDLVELTGVIAAEVSKIPARALDVWHAAGREALSFAPSGPA
jgi:hypothetical protein